MYLKTLFKITSLALAVVGGVSAQDDGAGYVFKCTKPGLVALTFDDGPSPFTPKLLDTLAEKKVPATFFVLGISTNEGDGMKTLKRAFDAGHQIALHSNTHADMNALTPAKIKQEYELNLKAVETAIGKRPSFARPPFGNCNEACAKVLRDDMKLTITQWNCDSNDWRYEASVADQPKTFTNVADIINPSNPKIDSFITLQHDIKDYSVDLTPKIIDLIAAKGYKFVTVEECLGGKIPAYVGGGAAAPAPNAAPAPPTTEPAPAPAADPAPAPAADPTPATSPDPSTTTSPDPSTAPGTGPGYVEGDSGFPSGAPNPSISPSAQDSTNSAGKLASTFSLTLICLALGLLY